MILGSVETFQLKRRDMIDILKGCDADINKQFEFLTQEIKKMTNCQGEQEIEISKKIAYIKTEYKLRWQKAHRMEERFQKDNEKWLDSIISFPVCLQAKSTARGRPSLQFEDCSDRTKRLKTADLRKNNTVEELVYATQMSLRYSGNVDASNIMKTISSDPEKALKYKEALHTAAQTKPKLMSNEEALATVVDARLSKHQYDVIRKRASRIFPSYKSVQEAKIMCYPKNISSNETCVKVGLQDLLDHTICRLFETISQIIGVLTDEELESLTLMTKWGFDGSSGHSSYKQAFHGPQADDAAVILTCIVPIRLICGKKIIWQNPRPSSTRYCRPLKIEFKKESTQISVQEKNSVDGEIQDLNKTICKVEGRSVEVGHTLIFAMIDGKVCNAITNTTSTQRCFICGASSKDFNNIELMINRNVNVENLEFGLSILHGWIRMFECLLHIAYKLPIQKWQARGENDKETVKSNKNRIQCEFREKCGLIIDKPKPGFGNTNDGNTARRFFQNATLSAEITLLDIDLIKRLHIILIVVSSGHEVDVEKFRMYTHETARYFVQKYPWYNMPPTLHKYLIHGPEVISAALLPIGQLSEEAQEARNKDFKNYRENHSRKCSRDKTNRDVFNFFLVSSDPVISSLRKLPKKKIQTIPKEALELLEPPEANEDSDSDDLTDTEE